MTQKTYYYFCNSCGGDTAVPKVYSVCPYCHAKSESLTLLGELDHESDRGQILGDLELARARWISSHRTEIGKKKPKGWFRRS